MPKTVEECEIEIAKVRGELVAKQKELDTQTTLVSHATDESTKLKAKVDAYEKAERMAIETEAHALKSDYDCKDKSLEVMKAFIEGAKSAPKTEAHGVPPTPIPSSTEKKKKSSQLEDAFNC